MHLSTHIGKTANSRGIREYFDVKGDLVKSGGLNANEKLCLEMLPDKESLWLVQRVSQAKL